MSMKLILHFLRYLKSLAVMSDGAALILIRTLSDVSSFLSVRALVIFFFISGPESPQQRSTCFSFLGFFFKFRCSFLFNSSYKSALLQLNTHSVLGLKLPTDCLVLSGTRAELLSCSLLFLFVSEGSKRSSRS